MKPFDPPRLGRNDAGWPKKKQKVLAWKAPSAKKEKVIEGLARGSAYSLLAPTRGKGSMPEGFVRGMRCSSLAPEGVKIPRHVNRRRW